MFAQLSRDVGIEANKQCKNTDMFYDFTASSFADDSLLTWVINIIYITQQLFAGPGYSTVFNCFELPSSYSQWEGQFRKKKTKHLFTAERFNENRRASPLPKERPFRLRGEVNPLPGGRKEETSYAQKSLDSPTKLILSWSDIRPLYSEVWNNRMDSPGVSYSIFTSIWAHTVCSVYRHRA